MPRLFGAVSIVSFTLAILLTLWSWSPPAPGSLARALGAPAPAAIPTSCGGLKLTGGHPGCLTLIQITCRPSTQRITAEGLLASGSRVTAEVAPESFALSFAGPEGNLVLGGGSPRTFDPARGAEIDTHIGFPGSTDRTRVVGTISCGF